MQRARRRGARGLAIVGAWGLLAAILACGGDGSVPDESLRPPGSGWHCVTNSGTIGGRCTRAPEGCEVHRIQAELLGQQRGQAASPTCEATDHAECFTNTEPSGPAFQCYREYMDCFRARNEASPSTQPSLCSRWQ